MESLDGERLMGLLLRIHGMVLKRDWDYSMIEMVKETLISMVISMIWYSSKDRHFGIRSIMKFQPPI